MSESPVHQKLAIFPFSLDNYITATPLVTKDEWERLEATFASLCLLSESEPLIQETLVDLLSFCKASIETKECIARVAHTYGFVVDNHITMVMDPTKETGFTSLDIVGFTLCRKSKDELHITYCLVKESFRRQNLASAMITSICANTGGIDRVSVDARATPIATRFFVRLGFVPAINNTYTEYFKDVVTSRPDTLLLDEQLDPIRGSKNRNTFPLFHYATHCHKCKDTDKKTYRCANCRTVSYCTGTCQGADWDSHKQYCISYASPKTS